MTPSSKYLFRFLFAAASQIPSTTFSQTISTAKLIEALQADDVYQTEKYGVVCTDLSVNFNENTFTAKQKEIHEYLIRKPDLRLHIRSFMYNRIGHDKIDKPDTLETAENYFELIKMASSLGDEQLLSELYRDYAAATKGSDKLYYLVKCLEIQDRIGAKYFRDISSTYYRVCELLYIVSDYNGSARYGAKGTALWSEKDKVDFLHLYILAADLTGASYLKINKPDSALLYYKQISSLVKQRIANPGNYRLAMAPDVLRIWEGIAKGGIGKAYLLQGNYDIAYSLLQQNLNSSTESGQWDDVANTLTSLAKIDEVRRNTSLALSKYLKAYSIALRSSKLAVLMTSAKGASNAFASLHQYDSAYVYHTQYLSWKDTLEKNTNRSRLDIVKAQVTFEQMEKVLQESQNDLVNQKRIRNAILCAILFLTVIALLIYNRKRLKLRLQTEMLEKEKQKADSEIILAQQQINHFTNNIAEKNNLITQLQTQLTDNSNTEINMALSQFVILTEADWQVFKINFEKINPGFIKRLKLKMPNITQAEQRIIMLANLGLNTKEMANASGVSSETIRSIVSRMRKKFNLETDIHTIAKEV